jgi:NAD(P)-dependent dehydrogenase (short-subunit alcohol dehydrogenase family)
VTYSLAGRAALITGASQGLGLAIARAYIEAGASVLVCARDADRIDRVGHELAALAGPSQIVAAQHADVSSPEQVEQLVARALGLFPHLDILVNNAGICGPLGEVETTDWREWTRTIEINLYGSVLAVRAVLPHMKSRRYGKIIQISGGGATTPLPRVSAYAASKTAVVRFAESLALEVREHGIDVNSIAPGALNTRMMRTVIDAGPSAVGQAYHSRMSRIASEGGRRSKRPRRWRPFSPPPTATVSRDDSSARRGIRGPNCRRDALPWTAATSTRCGGLHRRTAANRGGRSEPGRGHHRVRSDRAKACRRAVGPAARRVR